jgi:hypothetical protein
MSRHQHAASRYQQAYVSQAIAAHGDMVSIGVQPHCNINPIAIYQCVENVCSRAKFSLSLITLSALSPRSLRQTDPLRHQRPIAAVHAD